MAIALDLWGSLSVDILVPVQILRVLCDKKMSNDLYKV